jgi:tetratricopeptide (TPR) repeat protein
MRQQKHSNLPVSLLLGVVVLLCVAPLAAQTTQTNEDVTTGVSLFARGQFNAAQQFFDTFVHQRPTDPIGVYYLGRLAFESKQYDQASTWFEKAVKLDSNNSDYHLWLGRAYGEKAQHAEGDAFFLARKVKKQLETAVALNPDNLDARSDLLDYYLQAPLLVGGDAAKARAQAQEITKRNAEEGRKAWQKCEQVDSLIPVEAVPPREAVPPPQFEPAGAGQ